MPMGCCWAAGRLGDAEVHVDSVIQEGDTTEDTEARALLNKFLGATVLMAGMQGYVTEKPTGKVVVKQVCHTHYTNAASKY
ncbi:hypothetical protein HF086_014996 [Spodoptera exigua]|uniref:Uncharacterized protein n=1 Tax=Spodoptera exigua TaxID=7107 RepID=A0A922MF98_SPOEX|nr:hypothetical protein HF086_014996 [Spodoptera exigua]